MNSANGFVEEYTNMEVYCHSFVLILGTSLINNGFLTFVYLIALGYMFVGVTIVSDIFME